MLTHGTDRFTTGRTSFVDGPLERESKIYIEVQPGILDLQILAMVDTGAPYCIFDSEVADLLGLAFDPTESIWLSTRRGSLEGTLHRIDIRIIAQEGQSLNVESTVFVTSDWRYGNFLGYPGFLQRLRFAVDPSRNFFHFGSAEPA